VVWGLVVKSTLKKDDSSSKLIKRTPIESNISIQGPMNVGPQVKSYGVNSLDTLELEIPRPGKEEMHVHSIVTRPVG